MMLIDCPFCGQREAREYRFHRVVTPSSSDAVAALYERNDRTDRSLEYWHHRLGCQMWLILERNPSTNDVLSVHTLREGVR